MYLFTVGHFYDNPRQRTFIALKKKEEWWKHRLQMTTIYCQPLTQKQRTKNIHKSEKVFKKVWDFSDSNQGPIDLQSNALPAAPKSLSLFFILSLIHSHTILISTHKRVPLHLKSFTFVVTCALPAAKACTIFFKPPLSPCLIAMLLKKFS